MMANLTIAILLLAFHCICCGSPNDEGNQTVSRLVLDLHELK